MAVGKLPDSGLDEGTEEAIFSEINITPLTDIFLVMLIIFMVVSSAALEHEQKQKEKVVQEVAAEKRSGLEVNLPSGEAQEIDPTKPSLVVTVLVSGEVIVNSKRVEAEQLQGIFRQAFARDQKTQVVLKADKGVQHGRVVQVMETAKSVGLTRLAIGTSAGGG